MSIDVRTKKNPSYLQYEFCWVCLGPWDPHGASWYNCNRYNADDAKKARDVQEVSSGIHMI